jgi:DNA-binding CsgD family transcriptional regulator
MESEASAIVPWAEASADPACRLIDEASAITRLLRDLVPCSAFHLSAWDPMSLSHRHQTLASDGYSDATLFHVNDEFVRSNPAFAVAHRDDPRSLRWRDYKRDWDFWFPETRTAQEFLIPAGFKEGSTMCLRLPDGRYTGAVHLSWSSAAAATDERREITERFRPMLATVCDQLRTPRLLADAIAPNAFALVLSPTGLAYDLPTRAPGPYLGEGGALRGFLLEKLGPRMPRRFVWSDEAGFCHKVAIIPCRGKIMLVTEELVPWPYDLSFREIQVLHLVADGASNPQIAQQLFVSPRTISAHMEHILAKMGCSSRTKLAAMAISEGLLLAETPSRRAIGRKLHGGWKHGYKES